MVTSVATTACSAVIGICTFYSPQTPPSQYNLTITIEDRGLPPLSTSARVLFQLSDINEEVPQFSRGEYFATALSTTPVGTSLLQVSATDGDGGDNVISYSIETLGVSGLNFSIDSSGVIRNDGRFPNVAEGEPQVGS